MAQIYASRKGLHDAQRTAPQYQPGEYAVLNATASTGSNPCEKDHTPIRYEFVTREIVDVDVPAEWAARIQALDQEEQRRNRTETRRHLSLEMLRERGYPFPAAQRTDREVIRRDEILRLNRIIDSLSPAQQYLLENLAFASCTIAEIACDFNASESAVRKRIHRLRKKLHKVFE